MNKSDTSAPMQKQKFSSKLTGISEKTGAGGMFSTLPGLDRGR